jgi:hypothetical protein
MRSGSDCGEYLERLKEQFNIFVLETVEALKGTYKSRIEAGAPI